MSPTSKENMIKQQLRTWGVLNGQVLQALQSVPREYFVPQHLQSFAYSDTALTLPGTDNMLEPKVQARLLQACNPQPNDDTLVVGAGSGYLVALLTEITQSVTAMEIDTTNIEFAKNNLAAFNVTHKAKLINQDATQLEKAETFDCILVCASSNRIPNSFFKALKSKARLIYFDCTTTAMSVYRWIKPHPHDSINADNFAQLAPPNYLFQANAGPLINGIIAQPFTL